MTTQDLELDQLTEELNKVREEIDEIKHDYHAFTFLCYKYFYKLGKELDSEDYDDIHTDGANDGGIDAIYSDQDSSTLSLIQSKLHQSQPGPNDIIDEFLKMERTLKDFDQMKTSRYNQKVTELLTEKMTYLPEEIRFVYFHSSPINEEVKKIVQDRMKEYGFPSEYRFVIYDYNDIISEIESLHNPKKYVNSGEVKWIESDGFLKRDNNMMLNLSAKSLKRLYNLEKDNLFAQNLRFYVKNSKIDPKLKDSIKVNSSDNKQNMFWVQHNGITFVCRKASVDGNTIKLKDFSLVNGCQTTTLIGKTDFDNDLYIPCKIVMPDNENCSDEELDNLVAITAEGTNSQKPITLRDLKSNKPEQEKIKKLLEKVGITYVSKRGTLTKKGDKTLSNDYYAQLYSSFFLQEPGSAHDKTSLFASDDKYKNIFGKGMDLSSAKTIRDLLFLSDYYLKFVKKQKQSDANLFDSKEMSILTKSKFQVFALVAILLKYYKYSKSKPWEDIIVDKSITGELFPTNIDKNSEDFSINLDSLLIEIVQTIAKVYDEGTHKSVNNFIITEGNYKEILTELRKLIRLPKKDKEIKSYMSVFGV